MARREVHMVDIGGRRGLGTEMRRLEGAGVPLLLSATQFLL